MPSLILLRKILEDVISKSVKDVLIEVVKDVLFPNTQRSPG
jgi:hypothetical protein